MNASLLKKIKYWDVVPILLLGLLSLTWFRGDGLISGGDFGLPLDRLKYLRLMFYSWDETFSTGIANPRQLASLIPYALWGGITEILGLSLIFFEKSLFYIWFAGAGLSMYYLCCVLGMRRIGKLSSALFYMFNPFSLIIIWRVSHGLIQMPYAFAPLVLGMFIKGLEGRKGLKYIFLANLVWVFTTASAYANPRMVIVHFLPIGFFFFWTLVFQKSERRFTLKYTCEFLIFWLLLNFYWILPVAASLSETTASAHSPFLMLDLEQLKLTSVKFLEAVRMLGYWSMHSGYKGEPYYSYWEFYASPLADLISALIPVLVVLGFFQRRVRRDKRLLCFFLGIVFLGLLGINGASPPVGKLILWFYRQLPPLALLARFNFLFFGLPTYLVFSVLLGFGFLTVYDLGFKKIGWHVLAILLGLGILLNIVLVFPFWNGEVVKSEGKINPGERFQVPGYWWEAKNWLAGQKDFFRILPLPMSKTYNVALDWGEGYSGGGPTRWLTSQPVLNVNTGETFKIPMLVGEAIEEETAFKDVAKILGFLNTKYLLVRNDTRWEFLKGHGWWFYHQPENIEKFVKNQVGLSLEKEIGRLEFYRLEDKYLVPHIYASSTATTINGEVEGLADISQFLRPEEKEGVIFTGEGKSDFIWRRPSESEVIEAVYDFSLSEKGEYEILLRNEGFVKFYQSSSPFKIKLGSSEILERVPAPSEDNLISLGEIKLLPGKHLLTLFLPPAKNLVEDSSESTISRPISNLKTGESYALSFATKNLQGAPPFLYIWENYTKAEEPNFSQAGSPFGVSNLDTAFNKIEIPLTTSWQTFELTLHPSPQAKSFGISFKSGGEAENLFDAVRVERVFTNPLTLRRVSESGATIEPPKINFKKISPVKYEVEVEGAEEPFWLIFSESFHPGWTSSVGGEHLMINGFANGWRIEKLGDYKITLFFEPQKIYYFGVGVSLLVALASIGYLGLEGLRKISPL